MKDDLHVINNSIIKSCSYKLKGNKNVTLIWGIIFLIFSFSKSVYSQPDSVKESLKFYPLQNGDYWEYLTSTNDYPEEIDHPSAFSLKVIDDTVLSNEFRYKKILYRYLYAADDSFYYYVRMDSLTGCVYAYSADSAYSNNERKIDSLNAKSGDNIESSRLDFPSKYSFYFHYPPTFCISVSNDSLFNVPTVLKSFNSPSLEGEFYALAKGFGLITETRTWDFGDSTSNLVYALINGNKYGKKITGIKEVTNNSPYNFILYQNYPNPFNPSTIINYEIPSSGIVTLKIYDVLGRLVKTLVNKYESKGKYDVTFNGINLASGVYFYRLRDGKFTSTKKMLLMN